MVPTERLVLARKLCSAIANLLRSPLCNACFASLASSQANKRVSDVKIAQSNGQFLSRPDPSGSVFRSSAIP